MNKLKIFNLFESVLYAASCLLALNVSLARAQTLPPFAAHQEPNQTHEFVCGQAGQCPKSLVKIISHDAKARPKLCLGLLISRTTVLTSLDCSSCDDQVSLFLLNSTEPLQCLQASLAKNFGLLTLKQEVKSTDPAKPVSDKPAANQLLSSFSLSGFWHTVAFQDKGLLVERSLVQIPTELRRSFFLIKGIAKVSIHSFLPVFDLNQNWIGSLYETVELNRIRRRSPHHLHLGEFAFNQSGNLNVEQLTQSQAARSVFFDVIEKNRASFLLQPNEEESVLQWRADSIALADGEEFYYGHVPQCFYLDRIAAAKQNRFMFSNLKLCKIHFDFSPYLELHDAHLSYCFDRKIEVVYYSDSKKYAATYYDHRGHVITKIENSAEACKPASN